MKTSIQRAALAALLCAAAAPALAQTAPPRPPVTRAVPGQSEARTALDLMPAPATLTVITPAFANGGDIPFANTQYRTNTFPGLSWTAGPAGTKSYVLIMQDNDLIVHGGPILHWTMFNIPGDVTTLPVGAPLVAGSSYGPNMRGAAQPYTGPRTPPGVKDHYHFEIFALDTTIPDPGADYAVMTAAMRGHILASGEVVGIGRKDPDAPMPPPATH